VTDTRRYDVPAPSSDCCENQLKACGLGWTLTYLL